MRIFIANNYPNLPLIELVSGEVSKDLDPIDSNIIQIEENINKADAVLVPHDAFDFVKYTDYKNYINQISMKKLVIISDRGDFPKIPKFQNSIFLRVAINPGESTSNKIVIPYHIKKLSHMNFRNYTNQPKISFMGFIPKYTPRRIIKSFKSAPKNPIIGNASTLRKGALLTVNNSNLNFEYTLRNQYHLSEKDRNLRKIKKIEFEKMIESSDIILCPRGDANQSQRVYEVMSAGRIPLIPDSKMVFPLQDLDKFFFDSNFIFFNVYSKKLNQIVMNYWSGIKNSNNYFNKQNIIRDFFQKNLEFNTYVRNLFELDLIHFKSYAKFSTSAQ